MSWKKYARALSLEPQRTGPLAVVLVGMHALALLVCLILPFPLGVKILSCVLILWWLRRSVRLHLSARHPQSLRRALWQGRDAGWIVDEGCGGWQEASLCTDSIVLGFLIVLNFRLVQGGRRVMLITPGMLPAQTLRRLRVCLRTGAGLENPDDVTDERGATAAIMASLITFWKSHVSRSL